MIERHIPCEECGSSDGKCLYDDGHGYCFACTHFFPPIDRPQGNFTYEYLPWRGVNKSTMEYFGVSSKIDEEGKPIEIAFKYPNGNRKVRSLTGKHFYLADKGKKLEGLFGKDKFAAGGSDTITITEGELDALSLWQVLKSPVVSVQSASTALRDCTHDRSFLGSFKHIYLAFDNDTAGRDAVAQVAKLFERSKVFDVKFSNRKDANEYLEAGEAQELRNVWKNAKKYLPETIKSTFAEFESVLTKPAKPSVSYPFKCLNDMTYGIRRGETVLFIAPEKAGKTEVMHFIEHQLLRETDANIGAVYLEEPIERHLQAIAGIEDKVPYHLPDRAGSTDQVLGAVRRAAKKDERLFIYSYFGSDDPDILLDNIRFLVSGCGCEFILFDHLTMVVSGNKASDDERRTLDYITTRLEMMVKELNFGLIMVSHVNDNGQTRGSRYPTKVADITVSIQRDLQHPDPVERSSWYLRVLYNRFCGLTGPAGKIIFDRDTYSFREDEYNDGHLHTQGTSHSNDNWPDASRDKVA